MFKRCCCCRKLAQASSMDAEGKDNDVSFAQRKDQEDVSVSLLQELFFVTPDML